MIRILLADDQSLFREALRMLITSQPDLEVVGEAANGAEVLELADSFRPHVVLMDLQMPVMNGVAATRQLGRMPRPDAVYAPEYFSDGVDCPELGINIATWEDVGGDGDGIEWVSVWRSLR